MTSAVHIHPTAPLAERVLLPGDPGRALLFAQALLDEPRMFNHNRGLWGYTGTASDGDPLTIQSTGMGGPSAAIVIAELAHLGARRVLRTGTCGALDRSLGLGDLLIASEAISADGTSRALGARDRTAPDSELLGALRAASRDAAHLGPVASTDLFYDGPEGEEERWRHAGALAVEMETATLYALAHRRGIQSAALLVVSDLIVPNRIRIEPKALREAEHRMGAIAVRALSREHRPAADGGAAGSGCPARARISGLGL
jgi:purine-nucleoside phosphorylase